MLRTLAILAAALSLTGSAAMLADTPSAPTAAATADAPDASDAQSTDKAPGPCKQIVEACKSAGFVAGEHKQGSGLWADCVSPIMRGAPQPAKADKPLPTVAADVVAACKQARPNFGEERKKKPAKAS